MAFPPYRVERLPIQTMTPGMDPTTYLNYFQNLLNTEASLNGYHLLLIVPIPGIGFFGVFQQQGTSPIGGINISEVGGIPFALGQENNAGSLPVTLSTEQQALVQEIEEELDTIVATLGDATVTPPANSTNDRLKQLQAAVAALGTGLATQATLAEVEDELDTIVTALGSPAQQAIMLEIEEELDTLVTQTAGLATQATLAQVKSDLDTIVTQTAGLATAAVQAEIEEELDSVNTVLGTDGASPPTIPGTGISGWLRSIYDSLVSIIKSTTSAFGSTDKGIPAQFVQKNLPGTSLATGDGKYAPGQLDRYGRNRVNVHDSPVKTYSAAIIGLVPAAAATDIFTIIGAANTIVKVKKIRASGTALSDVGVDLAIVKRSTADTGGTSTTLTMVPHDSSDAAAGAVVRAYTANPTLGTLVGIIRAVKEALSAQTKPTFPLTQEVFDFGFEGSKAVILRGAAEQVAVNLNGQTITNGSFDMSIMWTEEPDT